MGIYLRLWKAEAVVMVVLGQMAVVLVQYIDNDNGNNANGNENHNVIVMVMIMKLKTAR